MPPLKAGHVNDFSNSLAEAIEIALQQEVLATEGKALPEDGQKDRRLLFVAIARGVLQYLKAHEVETLNAITIETGVFTGRAPIQSVELNYFGS